MLTVEDYQAITEHVGALVSKILNEREAPVGIDGIVIGGSWDPTTGTAMVIRGDTAAILPNGYDFQTFATRVPLLTPHYGEQYGVVGNERVILIDTQSGPAAIIKYDADDSPGAPAGEAWKAHRNASGVVDVVSKYTNNGPTTGDGLGGLTHVGGAYHLTQTAGGLASSHNDTTQQIQHIAGPATQTLDAINQKVTHAAGSATHTLDAINQKISHVVGTLSTTLNAVNQQITHVAGAAGAQVQTIVDGAGKAISHVVPTGGSIGLGALSSSLTSVNAAMRQTDISTYETGRQTVNINDFIKFANLLNTAGTVTSGQLTTILAALVAGWAHGVTIPTGSAVTKIL